MLLQIHEPGQTPLPHAQRAEIAVGIDLGTTNSLVAISESSKPEVILNKNGHYLTPSVVTFDENGKIEVGNISARYNSIRSIKRLMGLGLKDIKDVSELGFQVDTQNSEKIIRIKTVTETTTNTITPVEISAEILKSLKESAETALGHKVTKAVITVPAYFDDAARLATKDAATIAGLEVLRLINEPTAAALAYGLDKGSEGIYAIYDLGGGTFDITILKMQKGVFKVIATGGDSRLGGDDFDNLIFKKLIRDMGLQYTSHDEVNYLNLAARKLKEQLTDNNSAKAELNISGKTFNVEITKSEFETLASALVQKTINIFESTIEDAEIEVEQIKGVVLVGGSTRVPLVQKKLEEFVGKKPLSDVDPDKVVALGAAIQAESLTYGSENLLIDVNPLSLGLETYGGLMEVLIPRNTPIPTKAEQKFTTYEDGQTAMSIHILQGEREMVEHCRSLAKFDLRGIPQMPAGTAIIVVKFSLDADGILTVSAMEETTGKEQKIEVKPSYGLEASEIEKMLYSSIENAQSDIKLKLLVQSRNEAEIVIKTLESALAKDEALISADYKKSLENKISELKTAIAGTDRELIDFQVLELDKLATDFADSRVSNALKGFMSGKTVEEMDKKFK